MALIVAKAAASQGGGDPGEWIGKTAHYVRAGATGTGSGNDWTNAYTNLPASLTRDHVYYIGTGSYGSYDFNDALSSTNRIYVVKATTADHGTETGWNSSFAAQATFNALTMTTGYYTIDGQTRTETTRMEQPAGYGFRVTGGVGADSLSSQIADNSTFRYLDIGGTWSEATDPPAGLPSNCVRFVYDQQDLTFERCCFHDAGTDNGALAMMHGSDNITWDHCDFYFGWGKATIATPNVGQNGHITRYCRFWNAAQLDDVFSEGGGITTELGTYSWAGTATGNIVHGCIFYSTASGGRNAVIQYGESSPGPTAASCKVMHNTIVGIVEDPVIGHIYLYSGSGNEARNNLFYNIAGTPEVTANATSDNTEVVSDPFVDSANRDFRLASSPGTGTDLGAPYSTDFAGNARGASPHLGAYAFSG